MKPARAGWTRQSDREMDRLRLFLIGAEAKSPGSLSFPVSDP